MDYLLSCTDCGEQMAHISIEDDKIVITVNCICGSQHSATFHKFDDGVYRPVDIETGGEPH